MRLQTHKPAFTTRRQAGARLADRLQAYADRVDVVVLALPRGGVPVAFEVAESLEAPLDVFLVRKVGVPGHEELAVGAIAEGGFRVVNHDVLRGLRVSDAALEEGTQRERVELERRGILYRGSRPRIPIQDRVVILVDDGLATGASMRVAIHALKAQGPKQIVVAVPLAPADTCAELLNYVDDVVCAFTPEPFGSVGAWYEDFEQVSDRDVEELLDQAQASLVTGASNEG
jgi:predicted phosphoribosyltransferase